MYSNQPNNGYFAVRQLVGFYGEIDDLSILIDNIKIDEINVKYSDIVKINSIDNKDYFEILDLDSEFLNKKISDLSYSEYKILLLLDIVIKNPKLMILNYFDVGFNSKYKRKIIKLIKFIKASLNINFIVISNDVNFMNKLVKHVIVCKNKIIKYQGSIINAIKEEYIEEPPIYNFVRLANEKGANLEYTLDGKDLLKDIYRSVF